MKSTWFGNRQRYEFAKLISEGAGYGVDYYRAMSDWLTLASIELQQAVNRIIRGQIDEKIEAEYIETAKRQKDCVKMAQALGVLCLSLEESPHDFLGKVCGELAILDKGFRGQCFTPDEVSYCVARMNCADLMANGKPDYRIRCCEPAIGAGSMAIAQQRAFRECGIGPNDWYLWGTDVDLRMVRAAYIQLTLLDCPATIFHGNTLSGESWGHYTTLRGVMSPWRDSQGKSDSNIADSPDEATEPIVGSDQVPMDGAQMLLF